MGDDSQVSDFCWQAFDAGRKLDNVAARDLMDQRVDFARRVARNENLRRAMDAWWSEIDSRLDNPDAFDFEARRVFGELLRRMAL